MPVLQKPSLVVAWALILYISATSLYYFATGDNSRFIINMDGWGYYSYLPFIIETGATSYSGYVEYSLDNDTSAFFLKGPEGHQVNKFFAGEAVLLAPFYLAGHLLSSFTENEITGYSPLFFFCIAIAAYCYFALSVLTFRKILLRLNFSEYVTAFVLLAGVICTNLMWYVSDEPSMSHAFSFALFSSFILLLLKIKEQWNIRLALLLYFILGLIVLTRPTNLFILLFVPYFIDINLIRRLFLFLPGWPVFAAVCFIQPLMYYLQCGSWIVWSYEGSYFDLSDPHLMDTLFRWQKGLFIFFPVFVLSVAGFIAMLVDNWKKCLLLFVPLCIVFYVLSSWHAWHYGWSFGMRGYIEFYPFLFIPIAFLAQKAFKYYLPLAIVLGITFYSFLHTRSAMRMIRLDYGFTQEMTYEKWRALLFKHRLEMTKTMHATSQQEKLERKE